MLPPVVGASLRVGAADATFVIADGAPELEKALAAYFEGTQRFELELDKLTFQRSLLFTGGPIALPPAKRSALFPA